MLGRRVCLALLCFIFVALPAAPASAEEKPWTPEDVLELLGPGGGFVKPFLPVGYEEEAALGGAVALEMFKRYGLPSEDSVLKRYVNLLGSAVARNCDRADIPYHFVVLNTDEVNAFAAPGGYIFVTAGLLRHVRNEAELAGILGHEIAHVSQRHMLKEIERRRRYKGIGQITMAVLNQDPRFFEELIDTASDTLFSSGLVWDDEFDADRLGTEFARRTGYDPNGLRNFLVTLRAVEGEQESIFFRTHPAPEERLQRVNNFVEQRYRDEQALAQVSDRYQRVALARVGAARVPDFVEQVQAFVAHLYRSILEREADAGGLAVHSEALMTGEMSPKEMFHVFFNSEEYLQKGRSSAAFLAAAYRAILRRDPDPGGQATFLEMLESRQMTRNDVLRSLLDSEEYLSKAPL